MRRREFVTLTAGALALLPLTARAEQRSGKMPVACYGTPVVPKKKTSI